MDLVNNLKSKLLEATKLKQETTKDILRVALSEIQLAESRQGKLTDDKQNNVLRKIISNNDETITLSTDIKTKEKLLEENSVLLSFLPKMLSQEEVSVLLNGFTVQIMECQNNGQAIKLAISALKSANVNFNGSHVAAIVSYVRGK